MEKKLLGNRIKAIRSATGLSQEELAEMVDVSSHTISGIERGKNLPSYETLAKLAAAFGISVSELANEGDEQMPLERAQLIADINVAVRDTSDTQLRLISELVSAVKRHS